MRSAEEILSHINATPERNQFRLEFAEVIRPADPEWAEDIEDAIQQHDRWGYSSDPSKRVQEKLASPFRKYGDITCKFDRGFVGKIILRPTTFLEHGEALFDLAPIIEVTLEIGSDDGVRHWNDVLPAIVRHPALSRVRHLAIAGSLGFDIVSMLHIIQSQQIERLLLLTTDLASWMHVARDEHGNFDLEAESRAEAEMWTALFDSPVFRRMIDWGLTRKAENKYGDGMPRMLTQRQVGDLMVVDRPRSDHFTTTTYQAMPAEDRALEAKYGYIPRLHANNWGATILDVLRGIKPDFPAGTPVTEEMYVVPPEKEEQVMFSQ